MEPIDPEKTLEAIHGLKDICDEFLQKKNNLPFKRLVWLAKKAGFEMEQDGTSHMKGTHPTHVNLLKNSDLIDIQSKKGQAKPYQIGQVVEFIQLAQPKKDS